MTRHPAPAGCTERRIRYKKSGKGVGKRAEYAGEGNGLTLSTVDGYVEKIGEVISGTLRDPHIDIDRICEYFGRRCRVGGAEVLDMIARKGVPVEI